MTYKFLSVHLYVHLDVHIHPSPPLCLVDVYISFDVELYVQVNTWILRHYQCSSFEIFMRWESRSHHQQYLVAGNYCDKNSLARVIACTHLSSIYASLYCIRTRFDDNIASTCTSRLCETASYCMYTWLLSIVLYTHGLISWSLIIKKLLIIFVVLSSYQGNVTYVCFLVMSIIKQHISCDDIHSRVQQQSIQKPVCLSRPTEN